MFKWKWSDYFLSEIYLIKKQIFSFEEKNATALFTDTQSLISQYTHLLHVTDDNNTKFGLTICMTPYIKILNYAHDNNSLSEARNVITRDETIRLLFLK